MRLNQVQKKKMQSGDAVNKQEAAATKTWHTALQQILL